jgi:hypothetical protein
LAQCTDRVDLNDDIFPLNTNTYQITRGIRVESAAIILLTIFGTISQMRLWKIVKERREKKEEGRREQERDLNQLETEVGRRVEAETNRDLVAWEAAYGNGHSRESGSSPTDSVVFTKEKSGVKVKEIERLRTEDTIEMTDLIKSQSKRQSQRRRSSRPDTQSSAMVMDPSSEIIQRLDMDGNPLPTRSSALVQEKRISSQQEIPAAEDDSNYSTLEVQKPELPNHRPSPLKVIPLPIPITQQKSFDTDDQKSTASIQESIHGQLRRSKLSGSLKKRLSNLRNSIGSAGPNSPKLRASRVPSISQEALVIPHDDDRASSVAATADDLDDDLSSVQWSRPATGTLELEYDDQNSDMAEESDGGSQGRNRASKLLETAIPSGDLGADLSRNINGENVSREPESNSKEQDVNDLQSNTPNGALTPSTNPRSKSKSKRSSAVAKDKRASTASGPQDDDAASQGRKSTRSRRVSAAVSVPESLNQELVAQLPAKLSAIAQIHRTNEWAKHASGADEPEIEDNESDTAESPGIRVDIGFAEAANAHEVHELPAMTSPKSIHVIKPSIDATATQDPLLEQTYSVEQSRSSEDRRRSSTSAMSQLVFDTETPKSGLDKQRRRTSETLAASRESLLQDASVGRLSRTASSSQVDLALQTGHLSIPTSRATTPKPGTKRLRTSSGPLTAQPLVESPVEETAAESQVVGRQVSSPLPSDTLLRKRESMVRNKVTATQLNGLTNTNTGQTGGIIDGVPVYANSAISNRVSSANLPADAEDVPLSERKALLKHTSRPGSLSHFSQLNASQQSLTHLIPQSSIATNVTSQGTFDSHQPKRGSKINHAEQVARYAKWMESTSSLPGRATPTADNTHPGNSANANIDRLARWRQGQTADSRLNATASSVPVENDEAKQMRLLAEQRQRELREQAQQLEKARRETLMDQAMRSRDMQELHREQIRKMQARANASAS